VAGPPTRVLWIVNLTPARGEALVDPTKATFGGWISTMLAQLADQPDMQVAVAVRSPGGPMERREINGIVHYYVPPAKDALDVSEADCRAVLADFKPDLLHAEGTEMAYTRRFLRAWPGKNIVSLQGVMHGLEPHEYGGLAIEDLLFSWKLGPTLAGASLLAARHLLFRPRLKLEAESIGLAKAVIGRTEWDRAHAFALNPDAPYFTVHRILRPAFYGEPWKLDGVERHSIFLSNALAVRKGVHFVMEAVAQLRRHYPDIRVYIAGAPVTPEGLRDWKKHVGYPAYLRHLMKALKVEDIVTFLGTLSADEMAARMRMSHVFLLSSLIENSPNSLAEAMAVGAPVVSAYAGGAPDMAEAGKEALFYRPIDPQMMAWRIRQIFESDELAQSLGAAARKRAFETHDPKANRDRLLAAYKTVMEANT